MTMGQTSTDAVSGSRYIPTAVYFSDSDCVEYVKDDGFCIYERVDQFLTLIFDETKIGLVGFKLKGFKYLLSQHANFNLNDEQFLSLVPVIEAIVTDFGDQFVSNDRVKRSYEAAKKLAANDNVQLSASYLKAA